MVSLCSPYWLQPHRPPASASWVQACWMCITNTNHVLGRDSCFWQESFMVTISSTHLVSSCDSTWWAHWTCMLSLLKSLLILLGRQQEACRGSSLSLAQVCRSIHLWPLYLRNCVIYLLFRDSSCICEGKCSKSFLVVLRTEPQVAVSPDNILKPF